METARSTRTPTAQEIIEHMPLVHGIVAHFMRRVPRSVQREDLLAAGTVGLFHALRSSAHTTPQMFASYARIRIRGSIVDELRRHDWSPRRRKDPNTPEGSSRSNVTPMTPGSVGPEAAPVAAPRVAVIGFDDVPASAAYFTHDSASPLEDVLQRRAHDALHRAMEALPERESKILKLRYFQGMASKAIAKAMGLSEARISQLHARATARLKELLSDSVDSTGSADLTDFSDLSGTSGTALGGLKLAA